MYLENENIKNISLELLLTEDSQSQPVRSGDIQALCKLVDEKIIKTGRIGGVPTDFIFAAVNMASKILCKLYEFYNSYIGENKKTKRNFLAWVHILKFKSLQGQAKKQK
jgi:hypothetical protein